MSFISRQTSRPADFAASKENSHGTPASVVLVRHEHGGDVLQPPPSRLALSSSCSGFGSRLFHVVRQCNRKKVERGAANGGVLCDIAKRAKIQTAASWAKTRFLAGQLWAHPNAGLVLSRLGTPIAFAIHRSSAKGSQERAKLGIPSSSCNQRFPLSVLRSIRLALSTLSRQTNYQKAIAPKPQYRTSAFRHRRNPRQARLVSSYWRLARLTGGHTLTAHTFSGHRWLRLNRARIS